MVEHHLAKVGVAGSNPVLRSIVQDEPMESGLHRLFCKMATWPSGKAEACKAFTPGSNPGVASNYLGRQASLACSCAQHIRAFSSGGERFPDTEEVRSSNLLTPTISTAAQMNVHLSRFFVQPGLLRLYASGASIVYAGAPMFGRCCRRVRAGLRTGPSLSNRPNNFVLALDAVGHPVAEAMPHRLFAIPCAVLCGGAFLRSCTRRANVPIFGHVTGNPRRNPRSNRVHQLIWVHSRCICGFPMVKGRGDPPSTERVLPQTVVSAVFESKPLC